MIYHILSEAETFSQQTGGALSRWAANVLAGDENSRIVCIEADDSWGFPKSRIIELPALRLYALSLQLTRRRLPKWPRALALHRIFTNVIERLENKDVVYIHNRPEFVPVFRKHSNPGVRVALHMHNSHLATSAQTITPHLAPNLTIFCSRFLEREALSWIPSLSPTAVVPNGADETIFYPRSSAATVWPAVPTILFVGRLVAEKGVHVFLDALRELDERGLNVRGRVVGSPAFGKNAQSKYSKLLHERAPKNVEFVPYASGPALAKEYRAATIFCCPSMWNEPFGMVNVEAMASGLPVVATAVGGIKEIFSAGGAILVEPNDSKALADALAVLANDEQLRSTMAATGLNVFVDRYRWTTIRRQYSDALASLSR